jgi:uncharacterized integral membrane protein
MVNEEKVILMTRMAAFAAREGKKEQKINQYFRSDYVGFEVVKSAISATIVFVVLFAVYAMTNFTSLIDNFYGESLEDFGRQIFTIYLIFLIGYCVISYIYFSFRYAKMRDKMKQYYNDLKKLRKMYEKD